MHEDDYDKNLIGFMKYVKDQAARAVMSMRRLGIEAGKKVATNTAKGIADVIKAAREGK